MPEDETQLRFAALLIILLSKRLKRDVIESAVESIPGIGHTAVFPVRVIREMVRMLCPRGGLVVDPYMGSGTTAIAAMQEKRDYLGMDVDPIYCEIAEERVASHVR